MPENQETEEQERFQDELMSRSGITFLSFAILWKASVVFLFLLEKPQDGYLENEHKINRKVMDKNSCILGSSFLLFFSFGFLVLQDLCQESYLMTKNLSSRTLIVFLWAIGCLLIKGSPGITGSWIPRAPMKGFWGHLHVGSSVFPESSQGLFNDLWPRSQRPSLKRL